MTALQPDRHSTLPARADAYGCRLAAIATPQQGFATLAWAIETDQLWKPTWSATTAIAAAAHS